jgi:hypothetical protein
VPTEDQVKAFLESHQEPVLLVAQDLRNAGYTVDENGATYLNAGKAYSKQEALKGYSLAKAISTGIDRFNRTVYGLFWDVSKGEQTIGSFGMFPMEGERNRLGRADYVVWPDYENPVVVANSTQTDDEVSQALQSKVAEWIKEGILMEFEALGQ